MASLTVFFTQLNKPICLTLIIRQNHKSPYTKYFSKYQYLKN
jgi:hypothetical protein